MVATLDWRDKWMQKKSLQSTDRVVHEVNVIIEAFYYGGCYDQLNLPTVYAFEILATRLQAIMEAYHVPNKPPTWAMAKYYSGVGDDDDEIAPSLRQHGQRRLKEQNELEAARGRSEKGVSDTPSQGGGGGTDGAGGARGGGGRRGGGGGARGGGRGNGLAPAEK